MEKKLRQVTDSVHGTIYFSEIESQMISTPFFYRLHDIYQSSTVYMTYPSNRTKRYEHCLGTMELAGQIFFSAMVNASRADRERFMKGLKKEFENILSAIIKRGPAKATFYCKGEPLESIIGSVTARGTTQKEVAEISASIMQQVVSGMQDGCLDDQGLNHQRICFFDLLAKTGKKSAVNLDDVFVYSFLYQCALEALRIVSLFHDVGHPPYSHIIESTLKDLLVECRAEDCPFSQEKADTLKSILAHFDSEDEIPQIILSRKETTTEHIQLHEMIGLKMLQSTFEGVLSEMLPPISKERNVDIKTVKILYFVTVVEFSFAILMETRPIFGSLHRILDGPVDADRLDYIVRDSMNAGTQWGELPYRRLIGAVRLFASDGGRFRLAFPEKMVDDLDDLIVARYKIFSRINYHHRTIKTASILQKSVKMLAEDYLRVVEMLPASESENDSDSDDASKAIECICPEIQELWCALGDTLGRSETENKIARWNDSWLISALSGALIKLSDELVVQRLCGASEVRSESDIQLLKDLLSEVLLNHKHYYSILKRQLDAVKLVNSVMDKAGITDEKLDQLVRYEYSMLSNANSSDDARDALYRIQILRENIIQKADFELLQSMFLGQSCEDIIRHILKRAQKQGTIEDYLLSSNPNRTKFGISDDSDKDRIYLYDPKGTGGVLPYDIHNTLYPLLQSYRTANLWLNVYVKPTGANARGEVARLSEQIAVELGERMKVRFDEIFPPANYLMQEELATVAGTQDDSKKET